MNNARRKRLKEAQNLLDKALDIIRDVLSEEDLAFNNLSEGLQQTLRGETMENNVEELDEASEQIENAINCLENVE